MLPLLEPAFAFSRTLPVDLLQTLFALLDPWGVADKYRAFAGMPQDSERAMLFVALEDWLNDGVPLAAEVARSCLGEWYGENAPARGAWRIAGLPIEPARSGPRLRRGAGARPHRAAGIGLPAGRVIPGAVLHQPAAGPYRHGRGCEGRDSAVAAAAGVAAGDGVAVADRAIPPSIAV